MLTHIHLLSLRKFK